MFGRRSLFGALSCLGLVLTALAAVPAGPVLRLLDHGFAAMASPADEPGGLRTLVLASSAVQPMRVPGMPAAERSGAGLVLASMNGPILAPVRGYEIRPLIC